MEGEPLLPQSNLDKFSPAFRGKNERFVVDRRGQPQAVMMSLNEYIDTIAPLRTA